MTAVAPAGQRRLTGQRSDEAATPAASKALGHFVFCGGELDFEPLEPACCLPVAPLSRATMPLPGLGDEERGALPHSLPPVVDAHVHLFPDRVFEAIWRWFTQYGWPIRYQLRTPEVIDFLLQRGVRKLVALHYAHKPGMARGLNRFIAEVAAQYPQVIGMGTVLPGEPDAKAIVEEAFALGLHGIKLHCHVQRLSPDDPSLHELYEVCAKANKPVVIHAGREPRSEAYPVDPYQLCSADRVERVLKDHPTLKLCVPHLGADEFDAYERLLERHDSLWLDTTMMLAEYFPFSTPVRLLSARPERILYGTDFPNLPYAWDRELYRLLKLVPDEGRLAMMLGQNALALLGQSVAVSAST